MVLSQAFKLLDHRSYIRGVHRLSHRSSGRLELPIPLLQRTEVAISNSPVSVENNVSHDLGVLNNVMMLRQGPPDSSVAPLPVIPLELHLGFLGLILQNSAYDNQLGSRR